MPRLRLKSNNTEFFIGTSAQQQEVDREGRFKIAHLLSEGESDSAVRYLETATQRNHGESLDLLGMLYATGEIVEKDPERAFSLFKRSATQGCVTGKYHLAMALREGFGCRKNLIESFAWLRISAKEKYPDALFALAEAFDQGLGVEKDEKQAEILYEQAALEGCASALLHQIQKTTSVEYPDISKTLRWLHMASAADVPLGMLAVARQILESDPVGVPKAISLLERAVSLEDMDSMTELAILWYENRFVPRDWVQAIVYAHMASTKGSQEAELILERYRSEAPEESLMKAIEIVSLGNREEILTELRNRQDFQVKF